MPTRALRRNSSKKVFIRIITIFLTIFFASAISSPFGFYQKPLPFDTPIAFQKDDKEMIVEDAIPESKKSPLGMQTIQNENILGIPLNFLRPVKCYEWSVFLLSKDKQDKILAPANLAIYGEPTALGLRPSITLTKQTNCQNRIDVVEIEILPLVNSEEEYRSFYRKNFRFLKNNCLYKNNTNDCSMQAQTEVLESTSWFFRPLLFAYLIAFTLAVLFITQILLPIHKLLR